ncbi:unnamed protein product [Caenorhabditis nigoni]
MSCLTTVRFPYTPSLADVASRARKRRFVVLVYRKDSHSLLRNTQPPAVHNQPIDERLGSKSCAAVASRFFLLLVFVFLTQCLTLSSSRPHYLRGWLAVCRCGE